MTVATAPARRPRAIAPPLLVGGFALFVVAIAWLVVSSLATRRVAVFALAPEHHAGTKSSGGVDTLTIPASDERRWSYVDLERGVVLNGAGADAAEWDLMVRRYHVVPAVAAADLGPVGFDAASAPPVSFVASTFAAETTNAALARWYRYGMLTHLLTPNGHTYAVRTRGGRQMKMEVLSYYCPGPTAGCLTIRYSEIARGR